jgi:Tol biopolymer transport system component
MLPRAVARASAATVVAAAVSTLWVVPVAEAAYPGTNGDVAFSSTRNNDIAIYQVDPADPNIGTASGDASATSELTLGAGDVEPFYSPDGNGVYFSSDRDTAGDYAIFSIPANDPESATNPANELSAVPGEEAHNDYSPSVAPDDNTVVFNRDNTSIDTLWVPTGESSVCTLYTPAEGLLPDNSSDGSASRVVIDPVDTTKAIYVGADGDLHLLSGIKFTAGSNPCNQQSNISDTNLSTEAFAGTTYATGTDAFPDWSANGQEVVFNSSRGGGDTLFIMDNPTSATPTAYPVIPAQASTTSTAISTEPVFSPDGTAISFVQSKKGSTVYSEMLLQESNGTWQASGMENLSAQLPAGDISFDSEPDWQPLMVNNGQVPESPYAAALPGAALLAIGSVLGLRYWRSRRRAARA